MSPRRVATVPRLFQIKLRVPPVPRIWGPVLNAIQNLSLRKIAKALVDIPNPGKDGNTRFSIAWES
jgi:hypothetical protein